MVFGFEYKHCRNLENRVIYERKINSKWAGPRFGKPQNFMYGHKRERQNMLFNGKLNIVKMSVISYIFDELNALKSNVTLFKKAYQPDCRV